MNCLPFKRDHQLRKPTDEDIHLACQRAMQELNIVGDGRYSFYFGNDKDGNMVMCPDRYTHPEMIIPLYHRTNYILAQDGYNTSRHRFTI